MGNTVNALADFDKAIQLDPKTRKPYYNRAALNANAGNSLENAIRDYDTILSYYPTDSLAYCNRGITKINLKDTLGACSDWKKAVEYGNTQAKDLLHLYCNTQK